MPFSLQHVDFIRKAQFKKFMSGIQDMRTPVTEGTHSEIVPTSPVSLMVF